MAENGDKFQIYIEKSKRKTKETLERGFWGWYKLKLSYLWRH